MSFSLVPDKVFATYDRLTPEFLSERGITALLIDIDNTLAPYEQPLPDNSHREWFEKMAAAGVKCVLVSNNGAERVAVFAESLGVPAYADCKKPLKKRIKQIMTDNGIDPARVAFLGDQLLTDGWTARNFRAPAFIVPPIKDKTTAFFRFKRWLEVPFMKKYYRLHPDDRNEVTK